MQFKMNLHSHTYLCNHAKGDVDDYCQAAISNGLKVLGFSDHTPLLEEFHPRIRMAMEEFSIYLDQIEMAKKKYKDLKILKSVECDHDKRYESFYKDLKSKHKLDYLVGAVHWFDFNGESVCAYGGVKDKKSLMAYTRSVISAIQSGLYLFMAHPDLFANSYLEWDKEAIACSKDIIECASEYGVFLEINGYGFLKEPVMTSKGLRPMYPISEFWELVSNKKMNVLVNSDTHHPDLICGGMKEAYQLAKKYSLKVLEEYPLV